MINSSANYWIAANALSISLNALGEPNRCQCGLATGSVIMCYIKGVEGLEYDNGHNYRRWPLTISPTFFNDNAQKYVYVKIPRTSAIGTTAMICWPTVKLDIYGREVLADGTEGEQVGSEDYYYIWLQGIISSSGDNGTTPRTWLALVESGTLSTDEAVNPEGGQWYSWNNITQTVTFLKEIFMDAGSIFDNLKARLLTLNGRNLNSVAIDSETPEDSQTAVVTPAYIKSVTIDRYLRKDQDDATPYSIGIGGNLSVSGDAEINGTTTADEIQSRNYTGEGIADTGFRLTAHDSTGSSRLVVDNLYVRKKATFEELEVKKETAIAGNQIFSSAANVVSRTDYIDAQGNIIGYSYAKVPWLVKKVPILLHSVFFGRLRKTRIVIDEADISKIVTIRCYFLAKDGDREVINLWRGGGNDGHDLARCQTMNLDNSRRPIYISSVYETKAGNVYWWRKVVGVSSAPVKIDNQEYHFFDVSMTDCDAGSDIPAAGDHVVQFGNDTNPQRMNLLALEINGEDSPAVKAYRGIYTYNLSKCWWGGSPRKMLLSPASGYEFYGPSFKFVQEYGVKPEAIDRGAWSSIEATRDDYDPHADVRKCYYYDKVSHNGRYWLCVKSSLNDAAHWVDGNNNYITDDAYRALTPAQKALCSRKQNYTTAQPGYDAATWLLVVDKGDNMVRLDLSNEMDMVATDSTGKVRETRTITTEVKVYDGASEVALNQSNLTVGTLAYTDAQGVAKTLSPTITASGTTTLILSWTIQAGWTIAASNTISISYLYGGLSYQSVFSLSGSQGLAVFQLKPSMTAIPFSRDASNNLTPASQTVNLTIVKVDGASTAELTPSTYGVAKIRYSFTAMPTLDSEGTAWPSSGGVSVENNKENLHIALFNFYGVMIDRETIPVVVDGANGANANGTKMMFTAAMAESATAPTVDTYNQFTWYATAASPTEALPCVYSALWETNHQGTLTNLLSVSLYARYGKQGVNGKDGWMVTADPANVIITQGMGANKNTFTSAVVGFIAKKGSVAATISSIGTPTSSTFNVAKNGTSGAAALQVKVTSPKTSGGNYYTEGTFSVTVNVTDPDTGSNVAFSIVVGCYANLLGTWKQSVEDGTETIVANKVNYDYVNGVLTKDGRDYNSIRNATISNETWKNTKEATYDGYSTQITNTNKRIDTADAHIQTLETEMDGKVNSSEFYQTAVNVGLAVYSTVTSDIATAKSGAEQTAAGYANSAENNAKTAAQGYANTAESNANSHSDNNDSTLRSDLKLKTGIDIENQKITIQSDKVEFKDSSGNAAKFTINATDGSMKAEGGGSIGGFNIGTTSIGINYQPTGQDGYTYITNSGFLNVYKYGGINEALRVTGTANIYGTLYTQPSSEQNINGSPLNLNANANNGADTCIGNVNSNLKVNAGNTYFYDKVNFDEEVEVRSNGVMTINGVFANPAAIKSSSFTLPSTPKTGQFFMVKGMSNHVTVTIPSGYKVMAADGTGVSTNSVSLGEQATLLVYFGSNTWCRFNCG